MGEQQRRFKARQIEQQLIGNPALSAFRVIHQALFHRHFQALGIAVAANRQLRAGEPEELPGFIHLRAPN